MGRYTDEVWDEIFCDERCNTINSFKYFSEKYPFITIDISDDLHLNFFNTYLIYFGTLPNNYCEFYYMSKEDPLIDSHIEIKNEQELENKIKSTPEFKFASREYKLNRISQKTTIDLP